MRQRESRNGQAWEAADGELHCIGQLAPAPTCVKTPGELATCVILRRDRIRRGLEGRSVDAAVKQICTEVNCLCGERTGGAALGTLDVTVVEHAPSQTPVPRSCTLSRSDPVESEIEARGIEGHAIPSRV